MELHFIGTHHYNPRHRALVRQGYEELFGNYHRGEAPRFIAVEASQDQFAHVFDVERAALRRLVETEWPRAPQGALVALGLSLLFEGDAHRDSGIDAIRDARVVWLDDGDERDPRGMADRWLNVLRERVRRQPLQQADESDLEARIAIACAGVDKDEKGSEDKKDRDIKFAHRILNEVSQRDAGWAVVTVGKLHAADACDRMKRLLKNARFDCIDWFDLG